MINDTCACLDQTLPLWEANSHFTSYFPRCTSCRVFFFFLCFFLTGNCFQVVILCQLLRDSPGIEASWDWALLENLPHTFENWFIFIIISLVTKFQYVNNRRSLERKRSFKKIPDLCILVNVLHSCSSTSLFHSVRYIRGFTKLI